MITTYDQLKYLGECEKFFDKISNLSETSPKGIITLKKKALKLLKTTKSIESSLNEGLTEQHTKLLLHRFPG